MRMTRYLRFNHDVAQELNNPLPRLAFVPIVDERLFSHLLPASGLANCQILLCLAVISSV